MIDKSSLDKYTKWFQEELAVVDTVAQVTLKGHLRIEELLEEILSLYFFHTEHLEEANLRFYQKLSIARGLALRKNQISIWKLIGAINSLRNELAHSKNGPKRQQKIALIRQLYLDETKEVTDLSGYAELPDEQVIAYACAVSIGFLHIFLEDSKAFKNLVMALDKNLNG
jgi:hypothetical protein